MRRKAHKFLRKQRIEPGAKDHLAFWAIWLKLCLCEALYLLSLRATCDRPLEGRIQKKANRKRLRRFYQSSEARTD